MEGKIEHEGLKRHQENQKLNEEMCERMDEGFKNEESARKLVQHELAAMEEEMRQSKLGSGSTACSEASTAMGKGARGPPLGVAAGYNEIFFPKDEIQRVGCRLHKR